MNWNADACATVAGVLAVLVLALFLQRDVVATRDNRPDRAYLAFHGIWMVGCIAAGIFGVKNGGLDARWTVFMDIGVMGSLCLTAVQIGLTWLRRADDSPNRQSSADERASDRD